MVGSSTVERFCIGCGTERQVHIETGRCQTCGRATAHTAALPLNGTSIAPVRPTAAAQPADKLVLAETPALRRWVEQTQALADTFKDRAAKSEGFAQRFQSEAQTLARAARAFAGLLAQIGIEAPPPQADSRLAEAAGRAVVPRAREVLGLWHDRTEASRKGPLPAVLRLASRNPHARCC